MSPQSVAEMFRQATLHHQAGRRREAEPLYRAVLNFQPDQAYCLQQLGLLLAELGRVKEAVPFMERSCKIKTDIAAFWSNLGEISRQVDRLVEAQQAFHKALQLDPFFPEAHYNLANVLKQLGRHSEAVTHYDRALGLKPNYDRAWYNLGNTLLEEGRTIPAVDAYRRALALRPDWGDAHLNLANALYELRDLDGAASEYRRAAELKPGDGDLDDSLGNCLVAAGKVDEAKDVYQRANAKRPQKWLRGLRSELLIPVVVPSGAFIDEYRVRIPQALAKFADRGSIEPADLHTSGAEPPMLLAYQGRDDRPIKERFSQFYRERLPKFEPPKTRRDKPRIGMVVTKGHEGVFARCLGPLVARLDTTQFDVQMITSRSGRTILNHMLPNAGFTFTVLPDRVDEANELIRQVGFDVLVYWEIGTDSMNYFLPLYCPARVQVNSWGWPVTSGHPMVSDYLSAEGLEPPDGDRHYTERLTRVRRLPTYYEQPPVPAQRRGKEAFGIKANERLYLCQQNVRKYHPDFDDALAGILRHDQRGRIGIIADEQPAITELLKQRLTAAMPDVAGRLRILSRLEREPYLELVAAADVVLDTFHYGGGANTILDAVACCTPVITRRGAFHRGRWGAAINAAVGLHELTVENTADYVATATAVAGDSERGAKIRETIRTAGRELFEDTLAVREWNELLSNAAERAR